LSKRYVVIGGVAGGMSAAARLRRLDAESEIVVLEKSGFVSYANCGLPYYVGGVIQNEESLLLQTPESLFKRFRLDVRVGAEVIEIDPAKKSVIYMREGSLEHLTFDKLILSPGASPIRPNIPGIERGLTLRNIEDVIAMDHFVSNHPKSAAIIGGGFIGIELAENLRHRGISTTVVEAQDQVLAPLDPEMATFVADELIKNGIDLILSDALASVEVDSVTLASGKVIPAEMLILAIGVRPDTALANAAGLNIGERGGIVVDAFNVTSNPDIYAIGDAAEKIDALDGNATLVPLANLANRHGRIVADHIAGKVVREVKAQGTAIVKVFDLTVATSGWNEKRLVAANHPYLAIHNHPASHAGYYPGAQGMSLKLLVDPRTEQILGVQGVGREGVDKRIDVIATAMRGGITAPALADLELAYAPPFSSAKDPVNMLGYIAENVLSGLTPTAQWSEVESLVDSGYTIVDVRTAGEVDRGSLTGAINIPIDEIRERQAEIPAGKILVTCQVGQRGHAATRLLREMGHEAINLDGGYMTWSNSPVGRNSIKQNKEKVEK
jgi:NADPH-dependent 2,4-dienoyl-CoA reductase/sulfur reductase-like enzyme/rhodanese-related sulfurtransferase